MLRILVLSFVIATPLLSQDLLINSIGTEYPGKLIEISDTHIYFLLEGQTIVSRLPKDAILRVVLADGRVAYGDAKIELDSFRSEIDKKPPLDGVRIAGELLAGGVGSFTGGVVGVYGLNSIMNAVLDSALMRNTWLTWYVLGGAIGCSIGSTLGVYLVGHQGNETGSFGATLLGAALGIFPFGPFSSPIVATLFFNLTRKYKTPPAEPETGLINIQEGQVTLATPTVYIRPNPFIWGDMVQTINLVSVRF
ncbi:MAG: hypothetical protein JSU77_06460 [Fidelibacterota bacterium]|nr:MAG: hypothetical protein JSU77_06460 [Candidatus Neomarinimicrobiota bacterium]